VVPGARVVTAHGQMDGKELEKRMMGFVDGEYDVLVATSIIESGLDIPNANTIIIYNAQNFGLSDLHQMSGRVGRSNKKAFCLLIAPPLSAMTDEARKRMNAITQFSELGSGFNIAMRDLDIRGAGNLLGGEQSGFMSDIGYEMYQKILNEAIDELKRTEFKDLYPEEDEEFVKETQIDTDLELLIPNDYVNQIAERLSLYRKLAEFKAEDQLVAFGRELTDRFGPMPIEVERLFDSMRLKWVAQELGFEQLIMKNGVMLCYFTSNPNSAYFSSPIFATMMGFINQHPQHFKMKQRNDRVYLVVSGIETVERALRMLQRIHAQVLPMTVE
jgi:transcription-repair coupling factor (superfamily II helicase)